MRFNVLIAVPSSHGFSSASVITSEVTRLIEEGTIEVKAAGEIPSHFEMEVFSDFYALDHLTE